MPVHILVPRWMDQTNTNAQNANAQALLARFSDRRARWTAICGSEPAEPIRRNGIGIHRLTSRFWKFELVLGYQSPVDAVFYPGPDWADEFGIRLRKLLGAPVKVIATMEGLIASPQSVKELSDLVGHPVFSQPGVENVMPRIRRMYQAADHIIAISPFLERAAKFLYGDEVSCLPIGVDGAIFHSHGRQEPARCRVVGCGTVKSSKNPQMFLRLAARYKDADFLWFGDGGMKASLSAEARAKGLTNLAFPGAVSPRELADEFRKSSILMVPSHSEGVPKVTHEGAACGLPIVLNGFFEAPTVVHNRNGLVAWSDEELIAHVGTLVADSEVRAKMGQQSAEMAKEWNWDVIAPQWEELILRLVT